MVGSSQDDDVHVSVRASSDDSGIVAASVGRTVERPRPDGRPGTLGRASERTDLASGDGAMWQDGRSSPSDFIYDWNQVGLESTRPIGKVALVDETLRDGLQSASVRNPSAAEKIKILRVMDALHIEHADLGLPGAGARAASDVKALCEAIRDEQLGVKPAAAARTLEADIRPIIRIADETGVAIELLTFLGASPIRTWAEGWTLPDMRALVEKAVRLGVRAKLPVSFVTEDTVRSHPAVLAELFKVAINEGATRLVLCDTVGHATPEGVYALFQWTRELLERLDAKVGLDFHGHNDRGLALVNSVVALKAGADRVHATALGIGERVGNCAMDQLLVNLALLGAIDRDVSQLTHYCRVVSESYGRPIPDNYPIVGLDAFRTTTGVHAAAILKAKAKAAGGHIANHVYSGVPSHLVGRDQVIAIGPMSGESNVMAWLERSGLAQNPTVVAEILRTAKASDHTLTADELEAAVARCLDEGGPPPSTDPDAST